MAGIFTPGEVKVRPGTYFNIQNAGGNALSGAIDGITAVLFKSDWGPLNEAVEVSLSEGYADYFGTAGTTDAIEEVFNGGAKTAICCRIGSGGAVADASLALEGVADTTISIKAKYVGDKAFSVTVREKLVDDTKKECIIYSGTREFEKVEFAKGSDESEAIVEAFANSKNFTVKKEGTGTGALADASQVVFKNGTNPTTTIESYSDGFAQVEAYFWNTICVDTEDTAVHSLLASFMNRIFQSGQLTMGVVAEKSNVPFETRMDHALAFNNEKMHYVVNPSLKTVTKSMDGYQTAARIAGMIAACPANKSLTHTVIEGVTELSERVTPSQIIKAETKGCLVLSVNSNKQIWIDSAINTLVTPGDNQDDGWKKIRRTKTRYELINRANRQADALIGKVDNDSNGRATIVSQVQEIGTAMIQEGKLIACKVSESTKDLSDGDSAYFVIDAIDKDSVEHIYLTFNFRFSTRED